MGTQAQMSATICGHEKSSHQGARANRISIATSIAAVKLTTRLRGIEIQFGTGRAEVFRISMQT